MLDWDPKGKQGPTTPLPDIVTIHTPKEEEEYIRPAPVLANDIEVPVAWKYMEQYFILLANALFFLYSMFLVKDIFKIL